MDGAPREKTRRPRDELGRLLPWDQPNRLELEDFDSLEVEDNHRLGIAHFHEGRFFPAHEAWETAWKQSKGTEDEEFFKGLSQLGAGYVHHRRGNAHGARTLLDRARSRLERFEPSRRGVDVASLVRVIEAHAERIRRAEERGDALPDLEPPSPITT